MFSAIAGFLGSISPTVLGITSLVVQSAGTLLSIQAQQRAGMFEQQRLQMQQQQLRDQAISQQLEAQSKENERRKQYFSNLSANRALMAQSGITLDSPSYRAFLQSNLDTYKNDVGAMSLESLEQRLDTLRSIQQSKLQQSAQKQETTSGIIDTIGRGLLNAESTINEFRPNTTTSTPDYGGMSFTGPTTPSIKR